MPSIPLPGEEVGTGRAHRGLPGLLPHGPLPVSATASISGGQSGEVNREVFERGQATAVLPYDPVRDEVVLIRQFRAGAFAAGRHPWCWEIVAGMIEDGETPEEVARREAIEEAAVKILDLVPLYSLVLSPGACSKPATSSWAASMRPVSAASTASHRNTRTSSCRPCRSPTRARSWLATRSTIRRP